MVTRRAPGATILLAAGLAALSSGCVFGIEDPLQPRIVPSPEPVELLDEPALAIAAGGNHSCALTAEDSVRCWGHLYLGGFWVITAIPESLAVTGPVVSLAAGEDLSCTLTASGTVECWGVGEHGALGAANEVSSPEPVMVEALAEAVTAVSVGYRHACALLVDGAVACWGDNESGRVGLDEDLRGTEASGPQVVLDAAERVVAGYGHSCASLAELVTCWGDNRYAQLTPEAERATHQRTELALAQPVVDLAVGGAFTCALDLTGAVTCWGEGLGHEDEPGLRGIDLGGALATQVVAGAAHACVLDDANQAWCWGDDRVGQVGDGGENEDLVPAPVPIAGGPYLELSAGLAHTCGRTEAGVVECWGANQVRAAGQLELDDDA